MTSVIEQIVLVFIAAVAILRKLTASMAILVAFNASPTDKHRMLRTAIGREYVLRYCLIESNLANNIFKFTGSIRRSSYFIKDRVALRAGQL